MLWQDWLSTKVQLTPLTRENVFGINMKDTKCDLIVNNLILHPHIQMEDVFKKTLLDNHLSALRLMQSLSLQHMKK